MGGKKTHRCASGQCSVRNVALSPMLDRIWEKTFPAICGKHEQLFGWIGTDNVGAPSKPDSELMIIFAQAYLTIFVCGCKIFIVKTQTGARLSHISDHLLNDVISFIFFMYKIYFDMGWVRFCNVSVFVFFEP